MAFTFTIATILTINQAVTTTTLERNSTDSHKNSMTFHLEHSDILEENKPSKLLCSDELSGKFDCSRRRPGLHFGNCVTHDGDSKATICAQLSVL